MASTKCSNFEQLQQLLRDLPDNILQPLKSETETEKIKAAEKYVYAGLKTAITDHVTNEIFKCEQFVNFGVRLDELESLKEKSASEETSCPEDSNIGHISIHDSKTFAFEMQYAALLKQKEENNDKIKILMEKVENKRKCIKGITATLEKL